MAAKLTKTTTIRLDDETQAFYDQLAEKDERKTSEYIRRLLMKLRKEGTVSVPKVEEK